jgi:hypothetical protein
VSTESTTPEIDLFYEGKHNQLFSRAIIAIALDATRSNNLDFRTETKANAD